jgi:hypothetical protein
MKGYFNNTTSPQVEYSYQYLSDGRVSKINEVNHAAGVNSEANFTYNDLDEMVKVTFRYSNGGNFEYEFNYQGKNIVTDKTTNGSQLCREGKFTYDSKVNPFKNLGYVDYALTNFSTNNRLIEDVNYISCAIPTLIPQSHSYEYDAQGYPTVAITLFTTNALKRKREFYYR